MQFLKISYLLVTLAYSASLALSAQRTEFNGRTFCHHLCFTWTNLWHGKVDDCVNFACLPNLDWLDYRKSETGWSWCTKATYDKMIDWFRCEDNTKVPVVTVLCSGKSFINQDELLYL